MSYVCHLLGRRLAYPIAWFYSSFLNRLHHTPRFIRHVVHPVRFASGNEKVRRPPLHLSVQLVLLIDVEFGGVFHSACCTVVPTFFAINSWVDLCE